MIPTIEWSNALIKTVQVHLNPRKDMRNGFLWSFLNNGFDDVRAIPSIVADECMSLRNGINVFVKESDCGVSGVLR